MLASAPIFTARLTARRLCMSAGLVPRAISVQISGGKNGTGGATHRARRRARPRRIDDPAGARAGLAGWDAGAPACGADVEACALSATDVGRQPAQKWYPIASRESGMKTAA
ncbi:hypothetical protein MAFF301069_17930 [Ralstonia pseudosolanacearum]|nr:hypothetical protein MAFF211491_18420 [Ralstonia solanacearum]BCM12765.1 hypothetical protein MAFF241648_19550 [Ralstonia solanacearum]BCN09814.1 hypothetical protein RPSD_16990 [Ralstonia solanacearum]BEU67238.1 hypothetical protein MAFF301069_17930 [Ralstonia pseudosolanacearum]